MVINNSIIPQIKCGFEKLWSQKSIKSDLFSKRLASFSIYHCGRRHHPKSMIFPQLHRSNLNATVPPGFG
jgi:hypothetical protein